MGNITFKITEAELGTEQTLNECQLLLAEKGTWGANSKAGGEEIWLGLGPSHVKGLPLSFQCHCVLVLGRCQPISKLKVLVLRTCDQPAGGDGAGLSPDLPHVAD